MFLTKIQFTRSKSWPIPGGPDIATLFRHFNRCRRGKSICSDLPVSFFSLAGESRERDVHGTRPRFVFLNGTRANTLAKLPRSARVLFSSILHGSRYNFYWFPRVDNIRFEHSGEMNCNICRAKLAGIFSSGGSIDRKANNEHFRENRRGEARVEGESAKDD